VPSVGAIVEFKLVVDAKGQPKVAWLKALDEIEAISYKENHVVTQ